MTVSLLSIGRVMTRLCTILLLALALAGCGSFERDKKSMALDAAVNAYGSALRWGYFETASGYLHPEARETAPSLDWAVDLRVTGYDVVQPAMMSDEETASQVVQIDYLYEDEQRVYSLVDRQTWRYDDESGSWWLDSGLPAFE